MVEGTWYSPEEWARWRPSSCSAGWDQSQAEGCYNDNNHGRYNAEETHQVDSASDDDFYKGEWIDKEDAKLKWVDKTLSEAFVFPPPPMQMPEFYPREPQAEPQAGGDDDGDSGVRDIVRAKRTLAPSVSPPRRASRRVPTPALNEHMQNERQARVVKILSDAVAALAAVDITSS